MSDIIRLRAKMRPCSKCSCITATIVHVNQDEGTVFICDSCCRKRGKLNDELRRFLNDFVRLFGRPTVPIEIRPKDFYPKALAAPAAPAPMGDAS